MVPVDGQLLVLEQALAQRDLGRRRRIVGGLRHEASAARTWPSARRAGRPAAGRAPPSAERPCQCASARPAPRKAARPTPAGEGCEQSAASASDRLAAARPSVPRGVQLDVGDQRRDLAGLEDRLVGRHRRGPGRLELGEARRGSWPAPRRRSWPARRRRPRSCARPARRSRGCPGTRPAWRTAVLDRAPRTRLAPPCSTSTAERDGEAAQRRHEFLATASAASSRWSTTFSACS